MPIHSIRPDVLEMTPLWERVRDCHLGQAAVKAKSETYLPPLPGHRGFKGREAYERFKNQALFLGATSRTVRGLVGAATWKPAVVETPRALDTLARDLQANLRGAVRELLLTGRLGLFVDSPVDRLDPYLALRPAQRIINYETGRDGFLYVVLDESGHVPDRDDPYEKVYEESYLELFLDRGRYGLRRHLLDEWEGEFRSLEPVFPSRQGEALRAIPFVLLGTEGPGVEVVTPPLLEVADLNIAHYQLDALHKSTLEKSALIQPYVTGFRPEQGREPLPFGGGHLWDFPNENTRVGMLEPSGAAFEAFEREKAALEERMAAMGARLLEPQKRAAETAEALRLRQAAEHVTLSAIVKSVEQGFRLIAGHACRWLGLDPEACRIELAADFSVSRATAGELEAWMRQVQAGLMSYERYAWLCNLGEVWIPGRSMEEELEAIRQGATALAAVPVA